MNTSLSLLGFQRLTGIYVGVSVSQHNVEAEDSLGEWFSLSSTWGPGIRTGGQAQQQAPFPTELSHWPNVPLL